MNIELDSLKGKKVLVIGDLMLDTYHIGDVKRISPEAPVPVVRVNRTYSVLGGAANVARNLIGLGCTPYVIGLVGNDANGKVMQTMFADLDIRVELGISEYPTVTKTRIIGNNQQIVRVDFELEQGKLTEQNEAVLLDAIAEVVPMVDVVVLSDYGKGVCTPTICKRVIATSKEYNKPVVTDPKGTNWEKYRGATLITPNLKELADVSGEEIKNEDRLIHEVAGRVVNEFNLTALLVTRSEKGMSYVDAQAAHHIPTEAREVFDVSGAGDTVVATLAASLAAGFTMDHAIYLANKAAGIVVAKIGTSPVLFNELQSEILVGNPDDKIISTTQLAALVKLLHMQKRKIVFTNGCFDILHRGHVTYLKKAKQLGDVLILALNSDASVKRLKGDSRPINDEAARCAVMAALGCVDYVVVFTEDTPLRVIEIARPDVLVKGGDYDISNIVGREYASQTVTIPFVEGYSTTRTINSINS